MSRFVLKSITPVKLTMFWLPYLFIVVSKLKRTFQEVWIIVLFFQFYKCYWVDGFNSDKMVWQK